MKTEIFETEKEFESRADRTLNGVSLEFVKEYGRKKAYKMNETNVGCWNCIDCTLCTDCTDCTDCLESADCLSCTSCFDCSNCTLCINCTNCSRCIHCWNSIDCTDSVFLKNEYGKNKNIGDKKWQKI